MPASAAAGLEARLRATLEEHAMLRHPFYVALAGGELERSRLREYARQFYHFEAAFPRFLSAIHARTESRKVRQVLLENLYDEEHGDRNHAALWVEFAAALGLRSSEVTGAKLLPATRELIEHFDSVAHGAPQAEALATLYAFEGQVPAVAWATIKALNDHFGLEPGQFEFFSVHLVADVAHASAEMEAIIDSSEGEDGAVAAARQACDLLLRFLDGCLGITEDN
ncbi:MAG: CADD family putative folate metabolism protein [Dehalococcoidia bacterium]|nr:CADD family putative folate metabolism protein [Dehalococcoidia bacterium]